MLSAHTDENADVTFQALDSGAGDFVTKPGGEVSMEMSRLQDTLVDLVVSVAESGGVEGRLARGHRCRPSRRILPAVPIRQRRPERTCSRQMAGRPAREDMH